MQKKDNNVNLIINEDHYISNIAKDIYTTFTKLYIDLRRTNYGILILE